MTEAQSTVISPPALNKRAVFGIVCGLLLLGLCTIAIWKGPIWPDKIATIFGLFPPLILGLLVRSWNRQFHPERAPARWPKTSRLEGRLVAIQWVLTAIFFFFMIPWIFVDTSKRPVLDHSLILVAITAQCWAQFFDRYIDDRKYIPPPDPLVPPSTRIAEMKPFQSEHWGESAVADPNPGPTP
jgi:hypothetical protein